MRLVVRVCETFPVWGMRARGGPQVCRVTYATSSSQGDIGVLLPGVGDIVAAAQRYSFAAEVRGRLKIWMSPGQSTRNPAQFFARTDQIVRQYAGEDRFFPSSQ